MIEEWVIYLLYYDINASVFKLIAAHEVGLVTLQVACEGFVISNSVIFEYKKPPSDENKVKEVNFRLLWCRVPWITEKFKHSLLEMEKPLFYLIEDKAFSEIIHTGITAKYIQVFYIESHNIMINK